MPTGVGNGTVGVDEAEGGDKQGGRRGRGCVRNGASAGWGAVTSKGAGLGASGVVRGHGSAGGGWRLELGHGIKGEGMGAADWVEIRFLYENRSGSSDYI